MNVVRSVRGIKVVASAKEPSGAEVSRTCVSVVGHGTLSMISTDGAPLGTYAAYTLDQEGNPVIQIADDVASSLSQ